jgi:hypothetical protein
MIEQLPSYSVFKVGDRFFESIHEAALSLGEVTLTKSYYYAFNEIALPRQTMFQEIIAHTPKNPPMIEQLIKETPRFRVDVKPGKMAKEIVAGIRQHLETYWDSSKVHIMPHSSGFDSRIVSYIIKQIAEERGKDWLGEIYFFCLAPEVSDYYEIMDWMGWSRDKALAFDSPKDPIDFHLDIIDFDRVGGVIDEAFRVMRVGDYFRQLLNTLSVKKEDVQFVSGVFGDETALNAWNLPNFATRWVFEFGAPENSFCSSHLFPYVSYPVLDVWTKYNRPLPKDKFKLVQCDQLHPKLRNFVNYRMRVIAGEISKEMPEWKFSPGACAKIRGDFEASWYYHNVPEAKSVKVEDRYRGGTAITPFWNHYLRAAICENIIRRGCKINP